MRVLDFTERNAEPSKSLENAPKTHECTCGSKFATKEQLSDLSAKLDDLRAKYEELSEKPKAKTSKTKNEEE
jgi:hypothetical protein